MKIVIEIDEVRFADIQRIASVQVDRRMETVEQIIAKGTPLSDVLKTIRGDIWLDGVNMTGEYQGVWTRFRDVEKSFDKALKEESE